MRDTLAMDLNWPAVYRHTRLVGFRQYSSSNITELLIIVASFGHISSDEVLSHLQGPLSPEILTQSISLTGN